MPLWRPATALACLAAFVVAIAAAAIPQLHEALHNDATLPQHECAITIVETGIESGDAPLVLSAPQSAPLSSPAPALQPVWVPSPFLAACVFEHAPPALS